MKTQFSIFSTCDLPDGTVLLAGHVAGPLLAATQRGCAATASGEVEIEVLSLGLTDPLLDKPDVQTLRARVVAGDGRSLKGAILNFD
jgi:hypothetical protein